jgi:hypothetical protein
LCPSSEFPRNINAILSNSDRGTRR